MNTNEHPVSQHLSWIAMGGRPSKTDVDELVARCVDEHSEISESELRREIGVVTKQIMEAHAIGHGGEARNLARESTVVLAAALGELPQQPSRDQGKSTRDIIAEVPR